MHVVHGIDLFELRVLQIDAGHERACDGDVDILVNRRRDDEAAVLTIVGREVGAASAERDAQGTSGDDHGRQVRLVKIWPGEMKRFSVAEQARCENSPFGHSGPHAYVS
jgi:hypothetical protein